MTDSWTRSQASKYVRRRLGVDLAAADSVLSQLPQTRETGRSGQPVILISKADVVQFVRTTREAMSHDDD